MIGLPDDVTLHEMGLLALSVRHSLADIPLAALVLAVIWVFSVGACVGSFVNVVAYRVPRRMSITFPGSHCPQCGALIRFFPDNVPLAGWCLLSGRCRNCNGSISIRYLLVEFLFASMFLLLAVTEAFSDGINLPLLDHENRETFSIYLLWGAYGLHMLMLSTLVAAALMEMDGQVIPGRFLIGPLAAAAVLVVCFPRLQIVGLPAGLEWGRWQGLASAGIGLGAGLLAGGLTSFALHPSRQSAAATGICGLIGVVLGWQAILAITTVALAVRLCWLLLGSIWTGLRPPPWSLAVAVISLCYLVGWRLLVTHFPFLGAP